MNETIGLSITPRGGARGRPESFQLSAKTRKQRVNETIRASRSFQVCAKIGKHAVCVQ
jgi:hypothetical protein